MEWLMEGKVGREIEQRQSREMAQRCKINEISGVKRYGTADVKRRRTESFVGITNLTIPILWIRNKKRNINKGYPLWITFI
ncbi:hypothetical protein [Paenibacillus sp. 2KB_22]|uniref:hypothetical protein n=1 Tax=Paenibacillus sp. 2KB_22 TaxID=3232978 RepID=UPI003F97CE77